MYGHSFVSIRSPRGTSWLQTTGKLAAIPLSLGPIVLPALIAADDHSDPVELWAPHVLGAGYEFVGSNEDTVGLFGCEPATTKLLRRARGDGVQLVYASCVTSEDAWQFARALLPYGPKSEDGTDSLLPGGADESRLYVQEVTTLVRSWVQQDTAVGLYV